MSSTKIYFSHFQVLQTEAAEPLLLRHENKDVLPIILSLSKQSWFYNEDTRAITCSPPHLINKKGTWVCLSRRKYRRGDKKIVGQKLLSMRIPEEAEPSITELIFKQVEVAVPGLPLVVVIVDVTVELFSCLTCFDDDPHSRDRVANQISESITNNVLHSFADQKVYAMGHLIPATRSSPFEALEELRLDDLEEVSIRQTPACAICLEDFAEGAGKPITRLPCAHYYHLACIVKSLKIRQTCPLCRYPMPRETVCCYI